MQDVVKNQFLCSTNKLVFFKTLPLIFYVKIVAVYVICNVLHFTQTCNPSFARYLFWPFHYMIFCWMFLPIMWDIGRRPCVMVLTADGRAVQHLDSTATQHSALIAQTRPTHFTEAQSPHTLTYWLNGGAHSRCSGARWWKGGHRGQSGGKMGLWRGRRSPDKTNSRDSKIGSPLQICSWRTKCTELLLSCI